MAASTDETAFLQKYGVADMSPDRKERPRDLLLNPADDAEWKRKYDAITDREAIAPYLGYPNWPPQSEQSELPINVLFASACRRKADVKRKQVADGTSHPDNFPDITIRSPDAAIAARIADMLEALADDLGNMTLCIDTLSIAAGSSNIGANIK